MGNIQDFHEENKEIELKKLEIELRETIKELKRRNNDLEEYQKLAKIGSWEYDIKSDIFYWSDEMYKIYEVTKGFYQNYVNYLSFIHPDDKDTVIDFHKESRKYQQEHRIEYRIVTKGGKTKYVVEKFYTKFYKKKPIRTIGVIMDITDRKMYEMELNEARLRAEKSDKMKSLFLANMSHEIRTPMNSIIGFSKLLIDNGYNKKQVKKYLKIINKNSEQLMSLINDIIDISKIDVGELDMHMSRFNLMDFMNYVYMNFSNDNELLSKSIQFSMYCVDNINITSDKNRLRQVLYNLLSNAIKFTDKGHIEFGVYKIENKLKFYVKDTGCGIPYESRYDIFNRFVQVNREERLKTKGTGLGLSISKGIVELLNGCINVKSKINKGSIFFFTIPLITGNKNIKNITKKDRSNYDFKGASILVAEDIYDNFQLIKEMLKKTDCSIDWAKNGKEAVDKHLANKYDIIMMDMRMPVMSGYEAITKIRETDRTTPIIAQTAYALTNDEENLIELGCTDYISKPISKEKLLNTISKYTQ